MKTLWADLTFRERMKSRNQLRKRGELKAEREERTRRREMKRQEREARRTERQAKQAARNRFDKKMITVKNQNFAGRVTNGIEVEGLPACWHCPECRLLNAPNDTVCFHCGYRKPQISEILGDHESAGILGRGNMEKGKKGQLTLSKGY
jgi:hypothetical protein